MATSMHTHAEALDVELVIGSYEHTVFGYKLTEVGDNITLDLSFTDKSHCGSIRCLAVSPRQLLASGSTDETITLLHLKTRRDVGNLMRHKGTVSYLEFYNEFMISSDETGCILIWKVDREFECARTLTGHKGAVNSMSVHPTGKLLLSLGADRTLRLWNLINAKRAYTTNLKTPADVVRWSPDGERYILLYSGKVDIRQVSDASTTHMVDLPGKGHSAEFLFENILAVGCEGGAVTLIDISSGCIVHEYQTDGSRVKCLSTRALDDDKTLLALVTSDGAIELHMVTQDADDKIEMGLVTATNTVLRPICIAIAAPPAKGEVS